MNPPTPSSATTPRRGVVTAAPPATPAPRPRRLGRTEQRVRLVDQREVGFGPRDVADVLGTRAVQQRLLVVVSTPVRRRADQRGEAEQVVHELAARQHRPHPFERGLDLGRTPDPRVELTVPIGVVGRGRAHRTAVLRAQVLDDRAHHERPPLVVRTAPRARAVDDALRLTAPQAQDRAVEDGDQCRAAAGARGRGSRAR